LKPSPPISLNAPGSRPKLTQLERAAANIEDLGAVCAD
jgi:hypothetical protein